MVVGISSPMADGGFRQQVEADWLLQEVYRHAASPSRVTPEADAAGGVDGVKNGRWGFHTNAAALPWWQVDLGASQPLVRVVLWNRCDANGERNHRIMVRLSDDAKEWRTVYTHNGTAFLGQADGKPLVVDLAGQAGRYVRVQLGHTDYLHLDEVEVYGLTDPARNIALHRPATQVGISTWSVGHSAGRPIDFRKRTSEVLGNCRRLIDDCGKAGEGDSVAPARSEVEAIASAIEGARGVEAERSAFLRARRLQRTLTLTAAAPLLDFEAILLAKRVPGTYNHMSDQYYGWWSRPGGGLCILRGFRDDSPTVECITQGVREPGSFLRPALSYDGRKVLFAWCRYYPSVAGEKNKLNKANIPEDAFYHLFEIGIDGTGLRQLTRGKYDDFDGRYLPDGRIVFLSTRRGQSLQVGPDTAERTRAAIDQPDCYVRCGGGLERPVAVYTLHTMDADGGHLCPISPFEMFEWTPSVADDGTVLYSRWDYVDRTNMPFMSLWSMNPDGTNARLVYKNYTRAPHCTFEPMSVPGSRKIVFTGSAHHAQTMGSLVLLDPTVGTEGTSPIRRLTPEVIFPEIEGWPLTWFANPWPLSERFYLVSWGQESNVGEAGKHRVPNGMGIYLLDAEGGLELLYRDPQITCETPIPLRARPTPPVMASMVRRDGAKEGRFLVADVTRGLKTVGRGDIKALRIVAVPPKTHPTMNAPSLGLLRDDPGKCVLGTVPVESDGSAYFRVPAGVIVFFQALDARGVVVQTMRSATHVQSGQTLSCIGCHESRQQAPKARRMLAAAHEPSRITTGPTGSWPLRYDRLVQPVLDRHCVECHRPGGKDPQAARFDLTAAKSYDSLTRYGKPSLADTIVAGYQRGYSTEGSTPAATSVVLRRLTDPQGHYGVVLNGESLERLVTWMDTYAQRLGSFSSEQERDLVALRRRCASLLIDREPPQTAFRTGP